MEQTTESPVTPAAWQFYRDHRVVARVGMSSRVPGPVRHWWHRERNVGIAMAKPITVIDTSDGSTCPPTTRISECPYHPAIMAALDTWGRPVSWHQLLLEMGRLSTKHAGDSTWVAFTPSEAAGEADRQTLTKVSKYLTRHWPWVSSHKVRDLVLLHTTQEVMEIWHYDVRKTICSIELGPRSCMKSTYGSIPFSSNDRLAAEAWFADNSADEPRWNRHPYAVYDPSLGWSMAVRYDPKNPGVILGRALVYENDGDKRFVRTYARGETEDCMSPADQALAAWLVDQGYVHKQNWRIGAEILGVERPDGDWMLPYVDGGSDESRYVRFSNAKDGVTTFAFCHSDNARFKCDNTNGTGEEVHDEDEGSHCEDCGAWVSDGDENYVGRDGDHLVCACCVEEYTEVRGSRRHGNHRHYHIPSNDAERVEGQDYEVDPEYLPDDIVQLECGGYAEMDDTVVVEGEYYMQDDPTIVYLEEESPDGDSYALRVDAWKDGEGNWHHDSVESITYDGKRWKEEDSWECEATGLRYPNFVEAAVDPETGDTVHPDYLQPCSRQADFTIEYDVEQDPRQEMLPEYAFTCVYNERFALVA